MSDHSANKSATDSSTEEEQKPEDPENEVKSSDEQDQSLNERPLDSISSEVQIDGEKEEPDADHDDADQPSLKKRRLESPVEKEQKEEEIPAKSIFGSSSSSTFGFSTFVNNSSSSGFRPSSKSPFLGFGSTVAPDSNKLIFGQIKAPSTSGFGSKTGQGFASSSVFGTSKGFGTLDHSPPSSAAFTKSVDTDTVEENEEPFFTPIVTLPQTMETIVNGEENEETILSIRAKLFKLSKAAPTQTPSITETSIESAAGGIQMATKIGDEKQGTHDGTIVDMDWKEVGIGPLRILTDDKHVRIVQRRENTPGGQGTKLILNIRLREECCVEKQADKFVKLAAFEPLLDTNTCKHDDKIAGEAKKFEMVQYLFKVKTAAEGDDLYEKLSKYCKSK